MQKLNNTAGILFMAVVVICATPTPSHAYLDAGSGSMMVQLLLAGTAGLAVLAKLIWQKIVNYFKPIPKKNL
jgi:hypothetical protein